jgi:hypothetical protein
MPYIVQIHTHRTTASVPFEIFRDIFYNPDLDMEINNTSGDIPNSVELYSADAEGDYRVFDTFDNADPNFTFEVSIGDRPYNFNQISPLVLDNDLCSNDTSVKATAVASNPYSVNSHFKGTWKYENTMGKFFSKYKYRLYSRTNYVTGNPITSNNLYLYIVAVNEVPTCRYECKDLEGNTIGSSINFSQVGQGFSVKIFNIQDYESGPTYAYKFLGPRSNGYINQETGVGPGVFFRIKASDLTKSRVDQEASLALPGFNHEIILYDIGNNPIEDPAATLPSYAVITYTLSDITQAEDISEKSLVLELFDELVMYEDDPLANTMLKNDYILINSVTINGNVPQVQVVDGGTNLDVNNIIYPLTVFDGSKEEHVPSQNDEYFYIGVRYILASDDSLYFGFLQTDPPDNAEAGVFSEGIEIFTQDFPNEKLYCPVFEESSGITAPPVLTAPLVDLAGNRQYTCVLRIKRTPYWNGSLNLKMFFYCGYNGQNGISSFRLIHYEDPNHYEPIKSIRNGSVLLNDYGDA